MGIHFTWQEEETKPEIATAPKILLTSYLAMQRLPHHHQDYFSCIPASLKAPLATFDTIDLGDEDVQLVKASALKPLASISVCSKVNPDNENVHLVTTATTTPPTPISSTSGKDVYQENTSPLQSSTSISSVGSKVDLGDQNVSLVNSSPLVNASPLKSLAPLLTVCSQVAAGTAQLSTFVTKIGGAQSKGRGSATKPGSDQHCHKASADQTAKNETDGQLPASDQRQDNVDDAQAVASPSSVPDVSEELSPQSASAAGEEADDGDESAGKACGFPTPDKVDNVEQSQATARPIRIGKIPGQWLSYQDSDSSSSSGSANETFTFRPIKESGFDSVNQDDDDDTDYTPQTRRRLILKEKSVDYALNLYPEDLDPTQIASPSKRKAYEKRLQRLQVKTSPIVRPRSTTPINVVTLDEYILNSPEQSPAPPSQDKLKISLPSGEGSSKPKSPRTYRNPSVTGSDPNCFVFNEEILFSHTRSALVVDEIGHVPPSPRRVLIPPTLSPSSSPKLGRATSQKPDNSSAQLLYFESQKDSDKIFGQPVDQADNENWAVFPESSDTEIAAGAIEGEGGQYNSSLSSDSSDLHDAEPEEFLTVNIHREEPYKPANIQVILSAASSPSSPESDKSMKADSSETVKPQAESTGKATPQTRDTYQTGIEGIPQAEISESVVTQTGIIETAISHSITQQTENAATVIPQLHNWETVIPQAENLETVIPQSQYWESVIDEVAQDSEAVTPQAHDWETLIPQVAQNSEAVVPQAHNWATVTPHTAQNSEAVIGLPLTQNWDTVIPQDVRNTEAATRQAYKSEIVIAPIRETETVLPQVQATETQLVQVAAPSPRPPLPLVPPPIPPRRRPPPPPPSSPPPPPPDLIPGDDSSEPMTATCDLLVDIDSL